MLNITFPQEHGQHYYNIHYRYLCELFKAANCTLTYAKIPEPIIHNSKCTTALWCYINGKKIQIDFSDSKKLVPGSHFKYHTTEPDKVYPLAPISFYDWQDFDHLSSKINYTAKGYISNRQRPYGRAKARRLYIQEILTHRYKNSKLEMINQKDFWLSINDTSIFIHIPGWRDDILDRGQLQLFAFGACVISPRLHNHLPFGGQFKPDVHYIKVPGEENMWNIYNKPSILFEAIDYALENPDHCKLIGERAKKMFRQHCLPEIQCKWIAQCLGY